ncbi:MAG: AI-2E family transporter [Myxococcota bacterium]|nr:AI-2E family transporter [Myxococcota bacterium]
MLANKPELKKFTRLIEVGEASEMAPNQTGPDSKMQAVFASSALVRVGAFTIVGFMVAWFKVILIPLVFAALLSFLIKPMVDWLFARKIPLTPAILLSELVATLPLLALALIFLATAGPLSQQLPKYQEQIVLRVDQSIDVALDQVGRPEEKAALKKEITKNLLPRALDESANVIQSTLSTATTALGAFLLILLLSGFMLNEASRFRSKLTAAFGKEHPVVGALDGIGGDVRRYVVTKTLICALTGFAVWVFLELCDVDFAAFWGLLAFPLNFIPTVGAVAASIPPIVLAAIDPAQSVMSTWVVILGLLGINGFIGSVLDPRVVGHAVKLSPLVVFVSMLVWGVLWGPVGMILAVPIMVSIKVVLSRISHLKHYAMLMEG